MARVEFTALLKCPTCGASGKATYSELDLQYPGDCNTRLVSLPVGFSHDLENAGMICCENCFNSFLDQ